MSTDNPYSILIADDNPNNLKVLSSMLEDQGYKIRMSCNGRQALKSIELMPPDLIMLDIHMPELDGYEACRTLKASEKFRDIPVIFVSAMSEGFNKLLAFEVGGIDYIVKPFQFEEVISRVKTHLALKKTQDRMKKYECFFEKYKIWIDPSDTITSELKSQLQKIIHSCKIVSKARNLSDEQQAEMVAIGKAVDKILSMLELSLDLKDTMKKHS